MRHWWLVLILIAPSVFADSLVVSSTANVEDHYIAADGTNSNFGNATGLRLWIGTAGRLVRLRVHGVDTLMEPYGSEIDSAFMKFYVAGANNQGGVYATYSVRRALKPFFEGDGTIGDGHPAGGTYLHWRDSTGTTSDSGYTTAGGSNTADSVDNRGDHARPDRWSTAIANLTGIASGWQRVNITTIARQWMGDTVAENGVWIFQTSSPVYDFTEIQSDTILIRSSEYTTDATLTPRFVFYYTSATTPSGPSPYRQGPLGAETQAGPQGASRRGGP